MEKVWYPVWVRDVLLPDTVTKRATYEMVEI